MSDLLDFSPPGQTTFTLAGARARFFDAGTTTLRTVYTDQSETVPHPDPLLADGSGRWPQAFVSGGPVKVVVTQSDGSTGYTLDPCEKVAAAGAGASAISFAPTVDLPFTNVQAAIEGAAASAAAGFAVFGLGVTGSVGLIANINATNTASGVYRFDNTTTGTFPTGVSAADTGAVRVERETAGSAWMVLYHDTTDRVFYRRMNASTWGAWREFVHIPQGAVQGNVLFRSATEWAVLAPGTSGQVLRTNGAGANPSWATVSAGWGYDSGNQTLTLDGFGTLAHGLGAIPSMYEAFLVCTTTDLGWAVGNTVVAPRGSQIGGSNIGVTLGADATNMYFSIGSQIQIRNRSTATTFGNITAASWRLVVRARI